MFTNTSKIYKYSEVKRMVNKHIKGIKFINTNKNIEYLNCPISLDIETTSTMLDGQKCAWLYEWTLGFNGGVIIGRDISTLIYTLSTLSKHLNLNDKRRIICYIQNLGYEFQFIRKYFEWSKVFSIDTRKPLYALIKDMGIECRCSYILSGKSLAKMGEELQKYPVQKMVGDLDYSLIRHSKTPLTAEELKYCENDVRVVMAYIQEEIERYGNITRIPLTNTGRVRDYVRKKCLYDYSKGRKEASKKYQKYYKLMQGMTLTGDDYLQASEVFSGGFTHANACYVGRTLQNVHSRDFTSSYPSVILSEKFPITSPIPYKPKNKADFKKMLKKYCCVFDVEFTNIIATTVVEHPISSYHCKKLEGSIVDNGRVVQASKMVISVTEQDFFIYKMFYKWDSFRIANFKYMYKGYLPKPIIESVLKFYKDKTTLKDVEGKEEEYLLSKGMLNSIYGMMVTNILKDEIIYTDEWDMKKADVESVINKYNKNRRRFLYYYWGVYVTAYARFNLFTGIYNVGTDYIYSDTDSIKYTNDENHTKYFEAYNKRICEKIEACLKWHKIPEKEYIQYTIDGKEKVLGVWEYEGKYDEFKTLGAKRYMFRKGDKYNLTVSGLNKKTAIPYMLNKYGKEGIFEAFQDGLYIPPEHSGKQTHTYIDDEFMGEITDYTGITAKVHSLSSIHLSSQDYTLSLSSGFKDYLIEIMKGMK
jgi:hypothetical protein